METSSLSFKKSSQRQQEEYQAEIRRKIEASQVHIHLAADCAYDEDEYWCELGRYAGLNTTREIQETTCPDCLKLCVDYGERARTRLTSLTE